MVWPNPIPWKPKKWCIFYGYKTIIWELWRLFFGFFYTFWKIGGRGGADPSVKNVTLFFFNEGFPKSWKYICIPLGNNTLHPLNSTDFLMSIDSENLYRMRYVNDTLYVMEKEYLSFEFAAFRGHDLYIKVKRISFFLKLCH